jgi:hypothetical protein
MIAVSNKTFIGAVIIALILIPTIGSLVLNVAEANPLPPSWMNPKMTITIQSPQNGTDNALPVFVNYTVQCSWQFSLDNQTGDWIRAFYYVLDGQNMSSSGINFTETQLTGTHPTDADHYYDYSGQAYLTNLIDGIHSITVYYGVLVNVGSPAEFIVYNPSWSATSQFYVITETPSPTLTPTPSPSIPEFPSAIILTIVLIVLALAISVFKRKKTKSAEYIGKDYYIKV